MTVIDQETIVMPVRRRRRQVVGIVLVTALLLSALVTCAVSGQRPESTVTIFGDRTPTSPASSETRSVELGLRFTPYVNGSLTGIRFFKDAGNTGPHTATLWSSDGRVLSRVDFQNETPQGWQFAALEPAVDLTAGVTYVASYRAPNGRYSADLESLREGFESSQLSVPVAGGVYSYEGAAFPEKSYRSANYFVDVTFVPSGDRVSQNVTTGAPTADSTNPSAGPVKGLDPPSGPLDLPRIPWEGRDYWANFRKADAAGWTDPTFFPVAVWWAVANSAADVEFDKSVGLNTYVVTNPDADYRLMEEGGMYWVGGQLEHATPSSKNWVGTFLDDEVDGRFTPQDGYALLKERSDASPPATTGRFRYANYTSGLLSYDQKPEVTSTYTNAFTDVVSVDQYFYGTNQCAGSVSSMRWSTPMGRTGITPQNCRTSSSYGKLTELLREADAKDGHLQLLWNFVSVVGEDQYRLNAAQVQGQVMNSLIHEARGIIWFPQSFSGGCVTGNAFRTYQTHGAPDCLKSQVEAAKKINGLIKSLAPVLNTQSYAWKFGDGLDTMLKVSGDSAYVFAMTLDGGQGTRKFALPEGVEGTSVEVVGEDRQIPVTNRSFSDSFAAESSYHIYKISLKP